MNRASVVIIRPGAAHSSGFSLVEVVVALSILSLVLLATITGLRTLANTQGALDRITERVDGMRAVSSFLRDALESAAVGAGAGGLVAGGPSKASSYFDLAPDALTWKSTLLIGEGFGGSYLLRVAKEDDLLVLRWQEPDDTGRPGDWSLAQERTLVEDLEEFDIAWRRDYREDWQRQWRRGDVAAWVRLQVKAAGRYWPELIIQVPQ
ncbi:MAG: prepilin-type N-terminal cleavage/methylation domain-containing protein [Pseudomonadales bacterium]|nr:prepilin-type N-terminal cleavage/methylation domain-containing protein [Pseudomonadales bacterium]